MSLDPARFAALMAPLGPFETAPRVAVAVSGGADSMALALLADAWARRQGGSVIAFTVDHALRPASAQEAAQVGAWLSARGISHQTLVWRDSVSGPGVQAAARAARYRLLGEACQAQAVLHLLLAHHRDDQAETLMLRLARGSGVDGLAAMAAQLPQSFGQILRPLLSIPATALRDLLRAAGQDWIEDPSNQSDRFDRVRWRRWLGEERLDSGRLAATAWQMGRARQALEADCADLAVRAVTLATTGIARLDPAPLIAAPDEIALRLLSALCRTIGGAGFPPRLAGVARLLTDLRGAPRRRTLAGCVFTPQRDGILICRESRAVAPPLPLRSGLDQHWDGRFCLRIQGRDDLHIAAIGAHGAKIIRDMAEKTRIPKAALGSMPAIMDKHGILAIPPLGWWSAQAGFQLDKWSFAPILPLVGIGFCLVPATDRPM